MCSTGEKVIKDGREDSGARRTDLPDYLAYIFCYLLYYANVNYEDFYKQS